MTDGNQLFGSSDPATGTLSYVGEGKKYATIDELDSAYAHVNAHAGTLETENATLRSKIEALESQDDAVAKVLEALKPTVQEADQDPVSAHQGVKTEELETLVESLINKKSSANQKQENNTRVRDTLKELYGDKAEEIYRNKGKTLNVDLDSLSETSPAAVLELFKSDNSQQSYWQKMYADKQISREEKFRQQHKSLEQMGQDYWK
jgi:hypothetical protein